MGSTGVVAYRGNRELNEDELRAHLASLLRLENVGVLLGAGASMGPLGGMTVGKLWEHFEKKFPESHAWLNQEGFLAPDGASNPERLLDTIEVTRLEWERSSRPRLLKQLRAAQADLHRAVIRAAILKQEWWEQPELVGFDSPELGPHRELLQKLTGARQPAQPSPWVFTTNYDLAIEWAAESIGLKITNGFDGLHHRTFSPHNFDLGYRNTLARGEARFGTYDVYLAKLHGSLSWHSSAADEESAVESATRARWEAFRAFLSGTSEEVPGFLVLPSAAKYIQTIGFVLGELIRRFSEFLSRPQTCLIVSGYSFSDAHLNRVIASAMRNPTLHLVIYLPEFRASEEGPDASGCQPWIKKVVGLALPQVTIVGGGARAYLNQLVMDLPEAALFDNQATQIRKLMAELKGLEGDGGAL